MNATNITYFATPLDWHKWLEEHHDKMQELWIGFYKKDSHIPSITWPEAVDEALCFGWIDGLRKGIDPVSYTIRFTPRKPRSIWSAVNIKRAQELTGLGLMRPTGLKAFGERSEGKSAIYAYEQNNVELDRAYEQQLHDNTKAYNFFKAQAAWYQRTAIWWIVSAKKEETKLKRLAKLIEDSEHGRTLSRLTWDTKSE
jgi:uncharacterized protein YdeI (YjbR/CyaY-like superfamily)